MVEPSPLTRHIESFVDSSSSATQQTAIVDAIASLLKNDVFTLEALVKELGMYLTTTDNIIRARGINLLGEVLMRVSSKPLDDAIIHNLVVFFTDRLADWKALRGALIGCLALMLRKGTRGMVSESDAKAVAHSCLQNLQVQSLGHHDRKLFFELFQCLLENYSGAVASMDEFGLYGIIEAMDGEKDPQCLMLAFHIVILLPSVFPNQLLERFAHELSEFLGSYFPLHFTHPKAEESMIRVDLSNALMAAFSSTSIFEPFSVPLFLQKLSSSLPSAKVDSLKYLGSCTLKYGGERMEKHAVAIWSSLKDAIDSSLQVSALSFTAATLDHGGFQENEIAREALLLLQKVVMQNTNLYLGLIGGDEDVKMIFNMISNSKMHNEISPKIKQKVLVVSNILSACTKASVTSCNRIFESYFPVLMDALGLSMENPCAADKSNNTCLVSDWLNFGALYLSIELIGACRDLNLDSGELVPEATYVHERWFYFLQNFSSSLSKTFGLALSTNDADTQEAYNYLGVKGLEILASYPGGYSSVSKSTFESILVTFMSIITLDFNKTSLWNLTLKALVHVGSFLISWHELERSQSYTSIVVDKIVSLVSSDDSSMPFSLKSKAISDIGTSGQNYMLNMVERFGEAISAKLSRIYVDGSTKSAEATIQLLECYSDKMLPWIQENGGCEESLLRFAVGIWSQIENCTSSSSGIYEKGLLNALTKAMKLAVGCCLPDSQTTIVQMAYNIISGRTFFPLDKKHFSDPVQIEGLLLTQETNNISSEDELIYSTFASVVIALHPQTHIPNIRTVVAMLTMAFVKGHIPAAQALGSIVNKVGHKSNGIHSSGDFTLEELIEIIFNIRFCGSLENGHGRPCSPQSNGEEVDLTSLCLGALNITLIQIHAIVGLAWIGKGLLMRGHEKAKDISKLLVQCLLSHASRDIFPFKERSSENSFDQDPSVMKSAADAFQILMSDSEDCLNRKFHSIIRPLYKQRFSSTIMPILQSLIFNKDLSSSRFMLYRAFAHVISDTPLVAITSDAKKLIPMLLDALTELSKDSADKDIVFSLLLVLSGILTDTNGQEAAVENAHIIIPGITKLVDYPHKMLVRETAIQCLVALSGLPHSTIYPFQIQVLQALAKSLDDPKRCVRQEAVRCRRAWS